MNKALSKVKFLNILNGYENIDSNIVFFNLVKSC